jgi:hypothetical protein
MNERMKNIYVLSAIATMKHPFDASFINKSIFNF